jgi:hypothetical protein
LERDFANPVAQKYGKVKVLHAQEIFEPEVVQLGRWRVAAVAAEVVQLGCRRRCVALAAVCSDLA